jgi:pyruvate dehydrogenase E1 component alpha subunit
MFLRIRTERYREHVGPGEDFEAGYRSEEGMNNWKSKDPLSANTKELQDFKLEIHEEISTAIEFAMSSPFPGLDELLTDVI